MKLAPAILATAALVTALHQAGIWGLLIPQEEKRSAQIERFWYQANVDLFECREKLIQGGTE